MNYKKILFLPLLLIFALICLTSCGKDDAQVVKQVSPGFVYLSEEMVILENGLHYVSWETQISFLDSEEICIYQTGFDNSDFIVKYKDEYYVNEKKLLELVDIAAISPEQRRRIYNLGDGVEIHGADRNYEITIEKVEEKIIGDKKMFDIKFSVTDDITETDLKGIFALAEITVGIKKGTDNMFDFTDDKTVRLEMKADRRLDAIILKSPDYPGLTYRVVVS